jgi:UDP-N-acetyl-D-mannosaminuronic acid dehydrogenase
VGGHCIPKDSWLLLANTSIETSLIPSARAVNRAMPQHVADLVSEALAECGKSLNGVVLAVLGYAYRENSDDTRDTPSQAFVEIVESAGALVRIHDPFVAPYQQPLDQITAGADAIVILVAHDEYKQTDWTQQLSLTRTPILIDTRRVLPAGFAAPNAVVRILGQGAHHA